MINPSEVGKSGEMVRLRTLESIWVRKLLEAKDALVRAKLG